MLEIQPFHVKHLEALTLQEAEAFLGGMVTPENISPHAYGHTAFVDGVPAICAGLVPIWQGRALAWALLADCGKHSFREIHYAVKRFLDAQEIRRIETSVRRDFPAGHRWARALGFRRETPAGMAGYHPDGSRADLYARVMR